MSRTRAKDQKEFLLFDSTLITLINDFFASLFAVLLLVLHGYREYFRVKIKTLLRFLLSQLF